MNEFTLSYQEVLPDLTVPAKWKEFSLNTGGTQSILQDIKIPERANGYCYKDASKYYTRNRFIYWKTNNDVLELIEQSLDINLSGNRIRLRFTDTPILDGITIYEHIGSIIILVPTVCSVHRLVFDHPNKIHKQEEFHGYHSDLTVPSIFSDISSATLSDPSTFYVINNPHTTNSVLPHVAASFFNVVQEETLFVFGYPTGELLLTRLSSSGEGFSQELKQETIVPRFLSGIAEALRGKNNDGHVAVSIAIQSLGSEIYAIVLCRDGNLKIWSCSKCQYIAISDVLSDLSNNHYQLKQGAHNHILRKSVTYGKDFSMAIYLSYSTLSQFHIIRPVVQNGNFKIIHLYTLSTLDQDLVDFSLDNKRLWAVWRGVDGECYIKCACLDSQSQTQWMSVILNPTLDPEYVNSNICIDPRQAYVNFIFQPGRFSLNVITKALSIYKRSPKLGEVNLPAGVLRQHVCLAVEQEIQTEVQEYEVSDEDYIEISNRCWSRFYSCCVQYHVAGTKPLGILLLPSVSGAVLLKKSMYSFLRPLDMLEQMMLCSDYTTVEQFKQMNCTYDPDICANLIKLMNVLMSLDQQLSDDFKYNIEKELRQLGSPDKIMSELVIDLMAGTDTPILSSQFLWSFYKTLSECNDLYQTMHLLLEMLRLDVNDDTKLNDTNLSKFVMSINHLFSSELGVSVVSEILHQQATVRFSICRNLLLLQNIILERRQLDWDILEGIRSVCMPETLVFMQAYYVVMWLCEQPATLSTLSDDSIQRLYPLKLMPVTNLKTINNQNMSLLQLFILSVGGQYSHNEFSKNTLDEEILPHWHYSLLNYVNHIGQLVWSVRGDFTFGEWLLASGQHLILQQYVRLLNSWCEWNNCSRNFILAVALLINGEKYKAKDLFLKSSKGIFLEKFLGERISTVGNDSNDENCAAKSLVLYHLKVIQLFELYEAKDCAIDVASTALRATDVNDPNVATLHSIMFVHHLNLGHYEEAYNALVQNPDRDRRENNLRDLVKTLLDNKMLNLLMSFPYLDMVELFTIIVIARARTCDSVVNIFYDFMYAFAIKRGYMRQAATIMYEQAYRLGQHNTIDSLEQQVKCYLACLNALSLINDNKKWVIRPIDQGEEEDVFFSPSEAGSNKEGIQLKFQRDIKPINLEEITKEFQIASARLRLARYNPETLTDQFITPHELVLLLSNMGIFKCALSLCKSFNVPYDGVFESLTKICILLTKKPSNTNSWDWLIENDITDIPVVNRNPTTVSWNLLQNLLEQYEEPKLTTIHKVVSKKIISLGGNLPNWLLSSYKKRNPSEILRLLYANGRMIEASGIAKEYLWAALGNGKEYFGLEQSLLSTSSALCLPINVIQIILYQLLKKSQKGKKFQHYQKEYEELLKVFKKYIDTVQRVSNHMCKMDTSA